MTSATSDYRLDGIYKQRQDGFYMQRVKLAAGVISSSQTRTVAAISEHFGQGTVHLTSRGSMEIHWLKEADLPEIRRELAKVGLTSRGACGGAVRGVTCGSQGAEGFPELESLARRLHRYFTGNPRFENLPKKFKLGIEADETSGRHLIQDVGIVAAGRDNEATLFNIWIAGGLGREPRQGFLLCSLVPETRIIPIIEAVINVYATHAPPPKRLKFLAAEFGEEKLRKLIEAEAAYSENLPSITGLPENLATDSKEKQRLELPVFAGQLTAEQLLKITAYADAHADGVLMVTTNQQIAMLLSSEEDVPTMLSDLLQSTGLTSGAPAAIRICPGSHECKMGLAATRDVAGGLLAHISEQGQNLSWAISGCGNSCSQPQLAEVGIVTSHLSADADGQKTPRFDVYRRNGAGFGLKTHESLTNVELITVVQGTA